MGQAYPKVMYHTHPQYIIVHSEEEAALMEMKGYVYEPWNSPKFALEPEVPKQGVVCERCGKAFKNKNGLRFHVKACKGEPDNVCDNE